MALFVMLLSFSQYDLPTFEERFSSIKNTLGQGEAPKRLMFTLQQNLNSILEEVQIVQDQAETGFEDARVVIEFESGSFFWLGRRLFAESGENSSRDRL